MATVTQEREHGEVSLYDPPLSASMCLEDVVRYYGKVEQNRKQGANETDSDRKHIRAAINELASSVRVIAVRLHVSQSALTKCMARHSICWYREILGADELSQAYWLVFEEAKKGHTVIRKQLEQITFKPEALPETVDAHWEIPNFAAMDLGGWQEPVGADTFTLLVYGMAWSLTTLRNREWDEYNIEEYFLPELRHLEKMFAFRRIDLEAFQRKLEVDNAFVPKS